MPQLYVATTLGLPVLWVTSIALAGGYDGRFIGGGSEEYRRVLNASVSLTAAIAIVSYAARLDVARGYVVIALPTIAFFDLACRYQLRKKLHRLNTKGKCLRRVAVVGHADTAGELIRHLQREHYHGLEVVAVCLPTQRQHPRLRGCGCSAASRMWPMLSTSWPPTLWRCWPARNYAVVRSRQLAWTLEETATDLYLAPALLDVAGPRTTIRPVAGLPLLHVDHPELTGSKQLLKSLFGRVVTRSPGWSCWPRCCCV